MASKDTESDTNLTVESLQPKTERSVSVGARPRSSSCPWRSKPVDIPRSLRERTGSASPHKSRYQRPGSPDKRRVQRKRSNSDSIPPSFPSDHDGIQLGSLMAHEAARSFWNHDMLYESLRKLTEYAAQKGSLDDITHTEAGVETETDDAVSSEDLLDSNIEEVSSEDVLDSNVEEVYTLEEEEPEGEGVSGVGTSDNLRGKSDTAVTRQRKSNILSSSLQLQSVLTSLRSFSDHQLQLRQHRNVFYPSSPMRRAYTDPCISPRLVLRKAPRISTTLVK